LLFENEFVKILLTKSQRKELYERINI